MLQWLLRCEDDPVWSCEKAAVRRLTARTSRWILVKMLHTQFPLSVNLKVVDEALRAEGF